MRKTVMFAAVVLTAMISGMTLAACASNGNGGAKTESEIEATEPAEAIVSGEKSKDPASPNVKEETNPQDAEDAEKDSNLNWDSPIKIDSLLASSDDEEQEEEGVFSLEYIERMEEDNINRLKKNVDGKVVNAVGYVVCVDDGYVEIAEMPNRYAPYGNGTKNPIVCAALPIEVLADVKEKQYIEVLGVMNVGGATTSDTCIRATPTIGSYENPAEVVVLGPAD